ncbi:MAG: DUF2779 domain-containing protein [Nanoarchaeota archaeon]|nr:DUF2779 domain-containing protein [Nanoarchaeota archaeon]
MSYEKTFSKSSYMAGLQCLNYLWAKINRPDEIQEPDEATQYRFDQGHLVGELAKTHFPTGIDIPTEDFNENISKTQEYLKLKKPLFEAGILAGRLLSRVDILKPVDNKWDIIEVKASNKVKEEHYDDVAFQKHCCEKYGLKIRKCYLMHLNKEYVRKGEVDAKELFTKTEITDEVKKASKDIDKRISKMLRVIDSPKRPDVKIGSACFSPYECPFVDNCWKDLPLHNVFDLYYGGKRSASLFEKKIYAIKDIPAGFKLTEKQEIQKESIVSGKPHVGVKAIKNFLSALEYPLWFFDFETFSTAVPIFDKVHPWQNIPFQYSLHSVSKQGAKPKHQFFLAEGSEDPRLGLLKTLKKQLGDKGSILVWNKSFEIGILEELAEAHPSYRKWIKSVVSRIVDLITPFSKFDYYHPKQHGSASMKAVLPVLTDKDYSDMEIGGDTTGPKFLDIYFSDTEYSNKDTEHIRKEMLKYCELDTYGEILILDKLREKVK